MAFIAHSFTVSQIIRRAATLAGEPGVLLQQDSERLVEYYDALNEFLQSFSRSRTWWWLAREDWFATKANQSLYPLRSQARASIAFGGAFASGELITISARTYGFEGSPDVELASTAGDSVAAAAAALVAAVNADDSAECYARLDEATTGLVYLYWLGNNGDGETVTATGVTATCTAFAYHLLDFSQLLAQPVWVDNRPLEPMDPQVLHEGLPAPLAADPYGYAMTQGRATLRIYSYSGGPPDAAYLIKLRYQARPSAVLPDGTGDLDFPEEFQDLLPHAIVLLLKAGHYDEASIFGDSWMQRRLAELESYQVDHAPSPRHGWISDDVIVNRMDTQVVGQE